MVDNTDNKRKNDENSELSNKKQALDNSILWKITFDQTQSLRTLVDVVGNILNRINFRVIKDKKRDVFFLCIDSIDPTRVCMIQSRLYCEKTYNLNGGIEFCLDSSILNLILKSIDAHYSIDIIQYKGSSDIQVLAYEQLSNSHHTEFKLPTLIDESETMSLLPMQFTEDDPCYVVEIDLAAMRKIVKMSISLRSQRLGFKVSKPQNASSSSTARTTFSIVSSGDAHQTQCFHSATVAEGDEKNTYIIRAATDSTAPDEADNSTIIYNESFATSFLNDFMKSMDRTIITMKLSSGNPLILHYPLGAERSYICFVLAPQTEEV